MIFAYREVVIVVSILKNMKADSQREFSRIFRDFILRKDLELR